MSTRSPSLDALINALEPWLKHPDDCGATKPPYTYCSCGLNYAFHALLAEVAALRADAGGPQEPERAQLSEDLRQLAEGLEPYWMRIVERAANALDAVAVDAGGPPAAWQDSRGYTLPPYVSVVRREDGGVQLEGHTATHDWELVIGPDGSVEDFTNESAHPAVPVEPHG